MWFRHPYTHTGPTPEIKAALDAFLNEHGYEVAPFTIEAADYAFAAVYERALMAGDRRPSRGDARRVPRAPGRDGGVCRSPGV